MRPRQSSLGIITRRRHGVDHLLASMRPRQSSLGINPHAHAPGGLALASMRPRQSSLGIHTYKSVHETNHSASMRPRQSSLGIEMVDRDRSRHVRSARASMRPRQSSLGICRQSKRRDQLWRLVRRFNEAEAIKPRNPNRRWMNDSSGMTTASMRPRQSSLGIGLPLDRSRQPRRSRITASMRPRQSSLGIMYPTGQNGRAHNTSFNEAEAIKPRNPCGELLKTYASRMDRASMRPRQSSLGISLKERGT